MSCSSDVLTVLHHVPSDTDVFVQVFSPCYCATFVCNLIKKVVSSDQAQAYLPATPPIVTSEGLEFGATTRHGCRAKSHEMQGAVRMILYEVANNLYQPRHSCLEMIQLFLGSSREWRPRAELRTCQ